MKTLFNKIDKLTNQIESGIYTKQQALLKIRELKAIIDEKYMPDSDNHTQLLYPLIDANELAKELN
jgi:diketogulonate reductase-like aldo/keto reductase